MGQWGIGKGALFHNYMVSPLTRSFKNWIEPAGLISSYGNWSLIRSSSYKKTQLYFQ